MKTVTYFEQLVHLHVVSEMEEHVLSHEDLHQKVTRSVTNTIYPRPGKCWFI